MPHWIWPTMIALVVMDTTVAFFILRRRWKQATASGGGIDFARVHQVGKLVNDRIVAYLQSSWNGQASELPEALRRAVEMARGHAAENGITLDDSGLRLVVTSIVVVHKIASRGQVARAFKALDAGTRTAAA
jgi:hypothetical protein